MTTPQEPAPEPEKEHDEDHQDEGVTTSADDVDSDGPLDADEGDPQVDSYPG